MVNYQNGVIYAIRSHQCDDIYIGSTAQPLHKRFYGHKALYKHWLKGNKPYCSSYHIIKYEDVYIELLEKYPCNDRTELNQREGKYIREMKCVNKCIAGGKTIEELKEIRRKKSIIYRAKNREKCNQSSMIYYYSNKGRMKKQKKVECECGSTIQHREIARHRKSKKHQSFVQTQKK